MLRGADWVLVENPKTASASIRVALRDYVAPLEKHCPLTSHVIVDGRRTRAVVVRNPFDRIVSGYYYNRAGPDQTFHEWLIGGRSMDCGAGLDFKRTSQWAWAFRCNHIIRFENLEDEFLSFCAKVGAALSEPLPWKNKSDRAPYREVVDRKSRGLIEDRFAIDFDEWGYKW